MEVKFKVFYFGHWPKNIDILVYPLFVLSTDIMRTVAILLCCAAVRRYFRLKIAFFLYFSKKVLTPSYFKQLLHLIKMIADL